MFRTLVVILRYHKYAMDALSLSIVNLKKVHLFSEILVLKKNSCTWASLMPALLALKAATPDLGPPELSTSLFFSGRLLSSLFFLIYKAPLLIANYAQLSHELHHNKSA